VDVDVDVSSRWSWGVSQFWSELGLQMDGVGDWVRNGDGDGELATTLPPAAQLLLFLLAAAARRLAAADVRCYCCCFINVRVLKGFCV